MPFTEEDYQNLVEMAQIAWREMMRACNEKRFQAMMSYNMAWLRYQEMAAEVRADPNRNSVQREIK